MSQSKLISIDLRADFGFFKKPDINDGILLSYNMIHKPCVLGILGAVIGLGGYQRKGEFPEYYQKLKDLPIGIEPLEHERGNYSKTSIKYTNTVGYANSDGTMLVEEMMLINPTYRCYLLLDMQNELHIKLYDYLKAGQSDYIPYLGKNEYQACWLDEAGEVSFREYSFAEIRSVEQSFKLSSVFTIGNLKANKASDDDDEDDNPANYYDVGLTLKNAVSPPFAYFERLPVGFDEQLVQYKMTKHVFTTFLLKANNSLANLYKVERNNEQKYVQLV